MLRYSYICTKHIYMIIVNVSDLYIPLLDPHKLRIRNYLISCVTCLCTVCDDWVELRYY